MYFGVYFGDQRGFVFCTGRRRSQGMCCQVFFATASEIKKLDNQNIQKSELSNDLGRN